MMPMTRRSSLYTLIGSAVLGKIPFITINNKDQLIDTKQNSERRFNMAGPPVKYARDVRNGWGVNAPNSPNTGAATAAALNFIGTRWVRQQFDGDTSAGMKAIQDALVSGGYPDPNLKLQLLLNDYLQNATINTWNNQQNWILNSVLPIKGANGKPILAAIEGPNEMNSGDGIGARGLNDSVDKTGGQNVTSDNPTANANFVDWARALASFKSKNASKLAGVEILSPTILYFFANNWSTQLNVSDYVDYGTFHYYAGINGTSGVPSFPPNPGNFEKMYRFAQAGICPNKSLVQSEGGFSSQVGGGYAQDGRSGARYQLMQIFDHHAVGGHRYMIYNLFNNTVSTPNHVTNYNEDNFGQYYGDMVTPKPAAIALHNLSNLLSLKNNYADPSNFNDTGNFTPAYTGNGFSVSGLQNAGTAGSTLIMPKSDGSTMIAVWNEPTIDTGSGTSTTPAANQITVNFGSKQTYNVYDPTGGNNNANFTAKVNLTPITSGSGTSVNLTLYGTPLLIELVGTGGGSTSVPTNKTPTSKQGTTITKTSDAPIGDVSGNAWSLVSAANGMQVAVNGVVDTTTDQVIALSFVNGLVWQENVNKTWWSKSNPNDTWSPAAGVSSPPSPVAESASGKVISTTSDAPIIDANGNAWTLQASTNGLQVAVNAVPDTTTSQVVQLAYVNGTIWQQNSGGSWWSKVNASDSWTPPAGTRTSPLAATTKPFDSSALQSQITSGISQINTALSSSSSANQKLMNAAVTALKTALDSLKKIV